MIKLPSINTLYKEASVTLKRFPFVLLSSVLGAFIMIYTIGKDTANDANLEYLYQAAMVCALGIPLLLSAALYSEREGWNRVKNYLLSGILILMLIGYYLSLPEHLSVIDGIRFGLFIIGMHLLVSFVPFITSKERTSFWLYNEVFFIRFLLSGLYSGVLFAGLAIAIVSIDNLFNADINENIYPRLFFFIAGVFNTWFFLSGIPQNFNKLSSDAGYPKGLKLFTQFVLLPLVTVYLIILYVYAAKIIFEWNWPTGWVSYLVLGFSIAGIFSILLVYPIRNDEGNRWMNIFTKWFYIALFPLVILLFLAIMRRISEYGITENRYFVFVLALWLAGIALYFTLSKTKSIKVIPVSLCIIAFLSSFGPWGAFSVSTNSQLNRLENYLTSNGLLENGKIKRTSALPSTEVQSEISSILTYLDEKNELDEIQPWFDINFDSINTTLRYAGKESAIMEEMGLQYVSGYEPLGNFNYSAKQEMGLDVRGYDLVYNLNTYRGSDDTTALNVDSNKITVRHQTDNKSNIIFILNGEEQFSIDIIKSMKEQNIALAYIPESKPAVIEAENEKLKIRMIIVNLNGEHENGVEKLNYGEAKVLIKVKE